MNYKRFEELPCWIKARELCQAVSEVQSQLYRALDCKYITQEHFDGVYNLTSECRMQIKGFRKYLRDNNSKLKD